MAINMERNVLRQNSTKKKEVICSSVRENITAPTWAHILPGISPADEHFTS